MDIISRARWGAVHKGGFKPAPLPAREVWLHHSVTIAPDLVWVDDDGDGVEDDEERAMRTLEAIGQQRFGGGISYTFAVMPSGRVYEGHGVDRQGAHTGGRNDVARAIVLVGDYQANGPTAAQRRAVAELLREGKARGWWREARLNGGHRDAPGASTKCPGDKAEGDITTINQLAAGGLDLQEDGMSAEDAFQGVKKYFDQLYPNPNGAKNPTSLGQQLLYSDARADGIVAKVVAALTADTGVDEARVEEILRRAVAEHTPTAEQVAAAQRPHLEAVLADVLGEDNRDQADEIVRLLGERLTGAGAGS